MTAASRRILKYIALCVGLALLIFAPPYLPFIAFGLDYSYERYILLHHIDDQAISVACYEMMTQPQYQPLRDYDLESDMESGKPYPHQLVPKIIHKLKPLELDVDTNQVFIEQTDHFVQMGLRFQPNALISNAYDLGLWEEVSNTTTLLYTLIVPTNGPPHGFTPSPHRGGD